MNAQDLKNSILQLAVQGKLVEQRAEEGTARELLEQIKLEKEQLIKDKKIKKSKLLPEITEDEIPFEIPESWECVRLNDIVCNNGQEKPQYKFSYIDIGSIDNVHQKLNKNENIVEAKDAPSRARKIVKFGDIIYSTVRPYLHNMCIIDKEFGFKPIASTGFAVMSCLGKLYNRYLFFYLMSPTFDNYANASENARGATYPAINNDRLYRAIVPIPPLEEQHRIVAKIEEILPYIDQCDKAYTKLETFNKKFPEDMKKSILQMAMHGKLVEQRPEEGTADELYEQIVAEKAQLIKDGKIKKEKPLPEITEDEIPFEIPSSWKWVYINEIAFVTKLAGFEYTKYMANSIMPYGEVPIVRAKNIKPNSFRENKSEFITMELSEKLSRCALDEKCVLMTFIGAGIGEVAVFDNIRRNHLAPNVAKIVPYVDINYFIMYYLMSAVGQAQVFQYMKQTAQPSLSMEVIRKVLVPLPPLEEQKRIVAKIEELLPYCDQLIK